MFSNSHTPNPSFDEGTVTQVDVRRGFCKVKAVSGRNIEAVKWGKSSGGSSRSGIRDNPVVGDYVAITYGLGYPLIFTFLDKVQSSTEEVFPLNIVSSQATPDTGNYSQSSDLAVGDANKPSDLTSGDKIISSEGGGILAALRSGSVLFRSSKTCQLFLSKLGDVGKLITRNWEHYTDVSTDIVRNFQGRVYRYLGYSNDFLQAKVEDYRYHQYLGDVSVAEAVKANYLSPPSTIPGKGPLLFKEQITDSSGQELMRRTLSETGDEERYITGGGQFTRAQASSSQVIISYGDKNTFTINDPVIKLEREDGAVFVMDASGIRATFKEGEINMSSSSVSTTFGGHYLTVSASGVQMG